MKKTGDKAEIMAIEYLKRNGYLILDTNFKFSRFGEVDIICMLDEITVFVEVKYRSSDRFGTGEESISKFKLRKIDKTIQFYCVKHNISFEKIRFDVISIEKLADKFRLTHYKNQSVQ